MALTEAESDLLKSLSDSLDDGAVTDARNDAYYEGLQRLEHLGLAVPPELRRFETVVNWPRVTVDSLEERLDIEGFRFPGESDADDELWRGWQANNMDEESQIGHVDAFVFGRAFTCVGTNEEDADTPIITVESPREMVAAFDARTKRVTAAARLYGRTDDGRPKLATLYLPERTSWLAYRDGGWVEDDRDEHGLGVVPVVPILNRRRSGRTFGVSEMADVIGLTDAAARSLTNLQIAAETHAVPQRGVLGATKGDFVDENNEPLPTWQAYFGAIWALRNENAKTFQFSASDLSNFHNTINHYAGLVSSLTGLPMRYLGQNTANPPSADAIRADEARLIKRAERKQRVLSGGWEQTMRLYDRIRTGEWDPRMRSLETVWRDPSTPTVAAKADATLKLVQVGVLPVEGAWDELGFSDARKKRLREQKQAQVESDVLGVIADQFRQPPPEAA